MRIQSPSRVLIAESLPATAAVRGNLGSSETMDDVSPLDCITKASLTDRVHFCLHSSPLSKDIAGLECVQGAGGSSFYMLKFLVLCRRYEE